MQEVQGNSAVLWLDNYVRPIGRRGPVDPAQRGRRGAVVSCSVLRVLLVAPLGSACGLPPVQQLPTRCSRLVSRLDSFFPLFMALIDANSNIPFDPSELRVPLDIPRTGVRRLPWRNYAVSSSQVGTQVGLLELLSNAHDLSLHTNTPLPLCVDENIHYRLLKLAHGQQSTDYDFHTLFLRCPPLCGIWHAYNYTLTLLFRTHFSLLTYLHRGTLAKGT